MHTVGRIAIGSQVGKLYALRPPELPTSEGSSSKYSISCHFYRLDS
jgi:hypothetical protein